MWWPGWWGGPISEERKHSAETAKHVSLVGAGKGRRKQTCSDTDAKETIEMITETLLASCLDNLEADGIATGAATTLSCA